ncbi:DMT family transporter [Amylibacter sp. SFDW26]|uniref:DMT family transporter n=1 Tax=Amylibacter sp. SFDW26 TaxID=2652722 RepID=UPI00186A070C|nr:DMT family transporter [Amylibacter sp. SFDW26]
MTAILGLIAAFAWGTHDILVRYVSQRTSIYSALFVVLLSACICQLFFVLSQNLEFELTVSDIVSASVVGLSFVGASVGLYKAFEIGPIRLVSPLIATFSIFAIFWGAVNGQNITLSQWIAVFIVLIGASIVAILSDKSGQQNTVQQRNAAIMWSLMSSVCFAITFELGHSSVANAPDRIIVLITRTASLGILLSLMLVLRTKIWPLLSQAPVLIFMGSLDAVALASVMSAGNLPNANYATVGASAFGVITIVMARFFFKERMSLVQWFAVFMVFSGITFLAL